MQGKTFKYAQHARHECAMDGFANHLWMVLLIIRIRDFFESMNLLDFSVIFSYKL